MRTQKFDDFEIGKMEDKDLKFLPELSRQYFKEGSSTDTDVEGMYNNYEKYKDNEFWHFIVMRHGEETMGYAEIFVHPNLFFRQKPYITVWWVRIEKKYRNHGLGKRLLQFIEEWGKEIGADSCCLLADPENDNALKLYDNIGYEREIGYVKDL